MALTLITSSDLPEADAPASTLALANDTDAQTVALNGLAQIVGIARLSDKPGGARIERLGNKLQRRAPGNHQYHQGGLNAPHLAQDFQSIDIRQMVVQ